MYQTKNMQEYSTKDNYEYDTRGEPYYNSNELMNYSNQNMDNSTRRKVNYDANTLIFNEYQPQASPQVPLPQTKVIYWNLHI